MSKIVWDAPGQRRFESGVDHGVFYRRDPLTGLYNRGYAWNGLTAVNESPSGAEPTPLWADNIKYVTLMSAEEFNATIEAFTYPDEFGYADGTAEIAPGVEIGQQNRETFGFSYRTKIGNDLLGQDAGYKIHLVYGCLAAPSEKNRTTINDSPEAAALSWELSTTAVEVGQIGDIFYKPTAHIAISSLTTDADDLAAFEEILYGKNGSGDPVTGAVLPRLPFPAELVTLFAA